MPSEHTQSLGVELPTDSFRQVLREGPDRGTPTTITSTTSPEASVRTARDSLNVCARFADSGATNPGASVRHNRRVARAPTGERQFALQTSAGDAVGCTHASISARVANGAREGKMTRLRDIMTRDVVSVSPDVSIRDAMGLLSSRHISGVPVVAGHDIVGVITSTDLMAFAAELSNAPVERDDQVPLEELPANDRKHPDELEPFTRLFTELWENDHADLTVRFANFAAPFLDALDAHSVDEAMTRTPIYSVPGDATLPAAAEYMRRHGIHRVFVTEKGKFVGIVTSTDIANAVASHKLRESQYVFGKEAHFTGVSTSKPAQTTLGARLSRKEGTGKPPRRPNRRGK